MVTLVVAAVLVVPFALLQLVNRRAYHEEFPFTLFAFMSANALLIAVAISPALRRILANDGSGR